jgi:hypothetical protein
MSDDQLNVIAGESEDTRIQRNELQMKLKVLESGHRVLKEHMGQFNEGQYLCSPRMLIVA